MFFPEVKKNFGFGCMRLPMKDGEVDIEQTKRMVDYFIAHGFNYFDTAHGYIGERSEPALREALTSRYPRSSYLLANKLSSNYFETKEDVVPFVNKQLEICGVDYFDFYLMHAQNSRNYEHYRECNAYEQAFELKKQGKLRHVGLSFHDSAEFLDKILTDYPEVEFVQIQFNYLDYNDSSVQSKLCYEVCAKHKKPVIVMEPIKGGTLVNIPKEAKEEVDKLGISCANLALRFAASNEWMYMVLSGMSTFEQMEENVSFMENFVPLSKEEREATVKIPLIIESLKLIKCTSCRYCVAGCPMNILIPDLFSCINTKKLYNNPGAIFQYKNRTQNHGKASDCIKCGQCENICPQNLPIRDLLEVVAKEFE